MRFATRGHCAAADFRHRGRCGDLARPAVWLRLGGAGPVRNERPAGPDPSRVSGIRESVDAHDRDLLGRPAVKLDGEGILDDSVQTASANCDERPSGERVSLVVLHAISLPSGEFGSDAIQRLFTNTLDYTLHPYFESLRGLRVSAHFLIRRAGDIVQFVPCSKRAWHAGASSFAGRENCNDFSVGIELEGTEDIAYTNPQYEAIRALVSALCARYPITDVVAHSDIAPGRKTDPGPSFDWERLRSALPRR